ncbi:chitinase [Kribbella sp. CA-293567]|uniref:chitinase n=1 Tax=Kribbella sp. CA-293567 TaxID=3002436 RepID=UPI0022DE92FF|nr:glycosyl hydrolase family 18 protein [Kribbella sp. CA-293567]WBQ07132.1 glycosyl hydrolase family 18 protein [Kribbella sp. CA-293567]
MRSRCSAALLGFLLVVAGLVGVTQTAQAANLLTNPGFEAGSLSGWSCSGGSVVTSPTRSGGFALNGAVSGSDFAQCSQTVAVQPSTAYTLSAWVRGSYVYLGVTGGASTWTPSASGYTQLTVAFTSGASQTSAQIYLHGWYGQPAYQADDVNLDGPGGNPPTGGAPGVPGSPAVSGTTNSAISLNWPASTGTVTGYRVYEGSTVVKTVTGTSTTIDGLGACTSHSYTVAAYNSNGESAKSAATSGTTTGCTNTGLPKHALIGYNHASFANGSGYVRMADIPAAWNIINLAFGEPTSVTSGDIRFNRCPVAECPNVESDAEFLAAIKAKQAQGKKVLISIGGQNGQVQLNSTAARDAFVSSISAIIDRWGLDGLDIDFEGHSLYLNAGDTDFRNPTTPVIVNLISAVKTLKAKYGAKFVLTMAPETFFVQIGYQFYGPGTNGGDNRRGSYLPVIHALRDSLTVLHVQDYNSGPVMGLDNQYHTMGNADFHIAMTDMIKAGFPVGTTGHTFPGLRQDQIAFGLPAATSAGNGYTAPAAVHQALDCLVKGQNCGGYTLRGGASPAFRGLMTWSINWDKYYNWEFQNSHAPYLANLP